MIRHVVLFKLRPDAPADEKEAWLELARTLPKEVDVLRAFAIGEDVKHGPRSYDVALVSDFDSSEDAQVYAVHPAHVPVAQMGAALCSDIATVDFEL